jgi:Vault protein inter-alpha-trypsin domain
MRLTTLCCTIGILGCNTPLPSETLPPAPPGSGAGHLSPNRAPVPPSPRTSTISYIAAGEQAPPFTLTTSDGAGLLLTRVEAKAVVDGPLAFTELHLYFHNPEPRVREGRFAVTLPDEAALSRFAMENDGQWMEAEVVPKMVARRAYEDFLHRRQDPALLEKADGNEFSARVFPIPAHGDKHLVLSYSEELRGDQYLLALRGLATTGSIEANVRVIDDKGATQVSTLRQLDWKPDRDFVVAIPALSAVKSDDLVAIRGVVTMPSTADPVTSATILVDSSASRALGYREQARALRALIEELAVYRDDLTIDVAAFDQETVGIYSGKARGFGDAAERMLAQREPLGASDLGQALLWAKGKASSRVIVLTDAMVTAGADASVLPELVRSLGSQRLDVVLLGGLRDSVLAAALTQSGLPRPLPGSCRSGSPAVTCDPDSDSDLGSRGKLELAHSLVFGAARRFSGGVRQDQQSGANQYSDRCRTTDGDTSSGDRTTTTARCGACADCRTRGQDFCREQRRESRAAARRAG